MLKILFWASVSTIIYVYIGYPMAIALFAQLKSLGAPEEDSAPDEWPALTVLIPAYNEERWIRRKIENTLALDYPRDRMQILVASDGSTDETVEIAGQFSSQGIEVIHYPERGGKTPTLNRAVREALGDILLFTDANALLEPDALRWLIPHFKDPEVGCVGGKRVCLLTDGLSMEGEGLYWRYESWIKYSESRFHSCLGADGQIYAVRRTLFPYVSAVSDDFSIPMKILVSTGAKTVFEPRAIARIPAAATLRQEWERKIRSKAALLCVLSPLKRGLIPWTNRIWWQFWSHHIFRLFVPFAMLAAFLSSVFLWKDGAIYRLLFFLQGLFYVAALSGFLLQRRGIRMKPFYQSFYFCLANLAVLLAWPRWALGKHQYTWEKTERAVPPVPSAEDEAT
jgi:cellulose synthase/poly-beta-1,6-N-acetylglucosamine synthase-like glycosyltransferase